ncbi:MULTISPECIES: DUF6305 family protein [Tepidanaerobacter]|jgi:hypothetical protein|uniref:DUF6305 family protein n=1 Tax=Tepidanaerobacter TaxID=499228 RepID=UPI000A431CFF|nr:MULTISPECIES: DUF6305 family protein [Tepidanaerobacter]
MNRICKKLLLITISILLVISVTACGSKESNQPAGDNDSSNNSQEMSQVVGLEGPIAKQPALLTSIGQSADVEMVKALMDNAGIQYNLDKLVKSDEIGNEKTLVLAVGGSSKGLGAAGINADDELKRLEALLDAAKDKNMTIIVVHVGGENRRGDLSDKFIVPAAKKADYIIVVEEGNKDGLFTKIASENKIPLDSVTNIADVLEPLKNAFE